MKKILIVSLLSLIIFGIINTLVFENTWNGFKHRFFLGFLSGIIPFFIGTCVYHFVLKVLRSRATFLDSLLGQIGIGILISSILMILFIIVDKVFYASDNKSIFESIRADAGFIFGSGVTVSVIYYFATNFFFREKSI